MVKTINKKVIGIKLAIDEPTVFGEIKLTKPIIFQNCDRLFAGEIFGSEQKATIINNNKRCLADQFVAMKQ